MEVWSRMFVVNVQSVSLQHLNWGNMKWCIQKSDCFAVVYVMQRSSVSMKLWDTSRDVLVFVDYLNYLQICDVTGAVATFTVQLHASTNVDDSSTPIFPRYSSTDLNSVYEG